MESVFWWEQGAERRWQAADVCVCARVWRTAACACLHMQASGCACLHTRACVYMCVCACAHACVWRACVLAYASSRLCAYSLCVRARLHSCLHTCVHACTCACMCVHGVRADGSVSFVCVLAYASSRLLAHCSLCARQQLSSQARATTHTHRMCLSSCASSPLSVRGGDGLIVAWLSPLPLDPQTPQSHHHLLAAATQPAQIPHPH